MVNAAATSTAWVARIEREMANFASTHSIALADVVRGEPSLFEIGVLHELIAFYERTTNLDPQPMNLSDGGEFLYLTSPNGNPANFSWIEFGGAAPFEVRQQVRVVSHLNTEISITPDLVVLQESAVLAQKKLAHYAGGKRSFFYVDARDVIACHECKSLHAFPELLAGFVGMAHVVHDWFEEGSVGRTGLGVEHLAPTLFIGGSANGITYKMAQALGQTYPMNIVVDLHRNSLRRTSSLRTMI